MIKNQKGQDVYMKQILSYLVAAMILSVSSIALVAALFARDIFAQPDSYVTLVFVLLFIFYKDTYYFNLEVFDHNTGMFQYFH